jgi:hypothetical protein
MNYLELKQIVSVPTKLADENLGRGKINLFSIHSKDIKNLFNLDNSPSI